KHLAVEVESTAHPHGSRRLMPTATVSVIIPAYRAARTIGRAIDNVLSQTRPPDEVLVIDDGSPHDLAAALKAYGGRGVLVRKPNGGAASARNLGIEASWGDLIAFLDADDYWAADKLEWQLAALARHPEAHLLAGGYFEQSPGRGPPAPRLPPP